MFLSFVTFHSLYNVFTGLESTLYHRAPVDGVWGSVPTLCMYVEGDHRKSGRVGSLALAMGYFVRAGFGYWWLKAWEGLGDMHSAMRWDIVTIKCKWGFDHTTKK